jgi:hypothetical protein
VICKRVIRAARGLFTDQRGALATFGGPPLCRHTGGDITRCRPSLLSPGLGKPLASAWFPRPGVFLFSAKRLLAVGAGPTLDFADATAFLAGFETVIEKVRRRRLQ